MPTSSGQAVQRLRISLLGTLTARWLPYAAEASPRRSDWWPKDAAELARPGSTVYPLPALHVGGSSTHLPRIRSPVSRTLVCLSIFSVWTLGWLYRSQEMHVLDTDDVAVQHSRCE